MVAKGLVLDVIHRYKYNGQVWFEPFLTGLLEQAATPWLEPGRWDALVPVPLHPTKRRERGFNQAERLAVAFGAVCGLPVNKNAVERVQSTPTQTRLTQMERRANVRDAFRCRAGDDFKGLKLILIDDVMTTGATTNACARELARAGAAEVCVWTVARGV